MSFAPRRIVAGLGPDGKSCVVHDGPPQGAFGTPTMSAANLWTGRLDARADSNAPLESGLGPFRFEQLAEPVYAFSVAEMGPGLGRDDPGMHFTDTADHFFVIEGEVVLVLESGDVPLRAGEGGVIRGVMHGWRNLSDAPARVVTCVIPATRAGAPA
jgi:mannose-6-phosphate isomerase-like protein (cupin superfamily)